MAGDLLFSIQTEDFDLTWRDAATRRPRQSDSIVGFLEIKPLVPAQKIVATGYDARPITILNAPQLFEETNYQVALRSKSGKKVTLTHPDPSCLSQLSAEFDGTLFCGGINFKSNAGFSRFSVCLNGMPAMQFTVEVYPSKIDYKTDYQQMIAETENYVAGIVFEYLRSTFNLGAGETDDQPSLIQWLLLLKAYIGKLEQALTYLNRNPSRALDAHRESTKPDRIKRIDPSVRKSLIKAGINSAAGAVIANRNGKVVARRTFNTLATPEHRWIAGQLRRILVQLDSLSQHYSNRKLSERETIIKTDLQNFTSRIARLLKLEFLEESLGDAPTNFASQRLMSAPGYRECYGACMLLTRGLVLQNNPVELALKEISTLYEYWTYLTTVFLLAKLTGCAIPVGKLVSMSTNGLELNLTRGKTVSLPFEQDSKRQIEVTYNAAFKNELRIEQRPDIVISIKDPEWPAVNLLLDAKYRVIDDQDYQRRFKGPGPPSDAVNVMHRYRDAILEPDPQHANAPKRTVVQAAALFPHSLDKCPDYNDAVLWKSIESVGIGAIPLLPNSTEWLEQWLKQNLQRGAWALSDQTIDSTLIARRSEMREAASEAVLLGTLRNPGAQEHLNWILDQKRYYAPYTESHERQLKAAHVAIYSPASIAGKGRGAITHLARVRAIEVKSRGQITTPWPSNRIAETNVVYELDNVEALSSPILNAREDGSGDRFSRNRWSSMLALKRATNLTELLLETEQEWRLYEDLRARGLRFKLRPGKIRELKTDEDNWRIWFELEDGRKMRAAGIQGIKILDREKAVYFPTIS